jgi:uncharacterized repeat protein (TIGR04076 family)
MCTGCNLFNELNLSLTRLSYPCRFHKKTGERFSAAEIMADFPCLELFNSFYPYYLATIYHGKFDDNEFYVRCPSSTVKLIVKTETFKITELSRIVLNFIKRWLALIRPSDHFPHDAGFRVVEVVGECPQKIKKGDLYKIKFNNTICPALLYSAVQQKASDGLARTFYCPSDINRICLTDENKTIK